MYEGEIFKKEILRMKCYIVENQIRGEVLVCIIRKLTINFESGRKPHNDQNLILFTGQYLEAAIMFILFDLTGLSITLLRSKIIFLFAILENLPEFNVSLNLSNS